MLNLGNKKSGILSRGCFMSIDFVMELINEAWSWPLTSI